MKTVRNYPGKDVEMLTTCATIIENAIENQDFLIGKRPTWADPFFATLKTRIDNAFSNHLGIDRAATQRQATQALVNLQAQALADLAEAKIQIEQDFKSDKVRCSEILKELGYPAHHKSARDGDQEALLQLLFQFKSSLTPALQTEITEKGTPAQILTRIAAYANQFAAAEVLQETSKGTKKTITEAAVSEFNAIYDQVIGIAKIAHNFYNGNPTLQSLFAYAKVHAKLGFTKTSVSAQETV